VGLAFVERRRVDRARAVDVRVMRENMVGVY
jgi:hypothetical protein